MEICLACGEEVFEEDMLICNGCFQECCGNCCAGGLCNDCSDAILWDDEDVDYDEDDEDEEG